MTDLSLKWQTVLTDIVTLSTGGVVLLIFFVAVTPMRRGFFCDDESIRYTAFDSTIPNWALYIYCGSIPFLVISITEFLAHRRSRSGASFISRPVPVWLIHMYRSFMDFVFGCVASQLVTDVGKYSVGRLRPNFIAICGPNIDLDKCHLYGNKYIENYICQNSDNDANLSRVSFPSGHSSFSAFTMFYTAIYIHMRWNLGSRRSHFRLVKCGVQICLILIAYYTALSRVIDNKHHWSDVTAGALIGVITASLTARYVSTLVNQSSPTKEERSLYSINSGAAPANNRRPQSNYDIEAQQIPKEQPLGEH